MSYERLNAYHIMWLIVMFDLPVKLKKDQKAAAQFRKNLEKDGFVMYQFSVYMRYCGSLESVQTHIKRVRSFAPPRGHISILSITDKQYSNIVNIWGEIEKKRAQFHCNWSFFSAIPLKKMRFLYLGRLIIRNFYVNLQAKYIHHFIISALCAIK